jgi:hypothetical protein
MFSVRLERLTPLCIPVRPAADAAYNDARYPATHLINPASTAQVRKAPAADRPFGASSAGWCSPRSLSSYKAWGRDKDGYVQSRLLGSLC